MTKESGGKLKCIACKRVITPGTIRQHKYYHKSCYNRLFKRGQRLKQFEEGITECAYCHGFSIHLEDCPLVTS